MEKIFLFHLKLKAEQSMDDFGKAEEDNEQTSLNPVHFEPLVSLIPY